MTRDDLYYRLAPGVDVVALGNGDTLLRSETAATRIEGESAAFFRDRILPLLDGHRSLGTVVREVEGLSSADLGDYLDQLVRSHVMRRSDSPAPEREATRLDPLLGITEDLGLDRDESTARLRAARAGIAGLEAHGAHLAAALARAGIGTVVLADPHPLEDANLSLMPAMPARAALGSPRHDVVRSLVEGLPGVTVQTLDGEIDRDAMERLVAGCDVVASCFDKSFSASHVWINAAAVRAGTPAVYAQLTGVKAVVGPLVVPGSTACYMCWRMRALACESDFEQAMAYEQFLDKERAPRLHRRSVLPFLAEYAAGIMAGEIVKRVLGLAGGSLAGRVNEFNGIDLSSTLHYVLERPDCPVCKKKPVNRPAVSAI